MSEMKPEVRFEGFEDDWRRYSLKSFGVSASGTSLESEFNTNGKYKVISIGSYSEDSKYVDQKIRIDKNNKTSNRILNKNDLTMVLNDKTSSGRIIGRVLLIDEDNKYIYNQRTQRIEINTEIFNPAFLYTLLNAPDIRKKIYQASQGNTQIYVNWTKISHIKYSIPNLKEQKLIGDYFYKLDKQITNKQKELNKLNHLKQAMLQKMFPKEGETAPEIRFGGFRDNWEIVQLHEVFTKGGSGGTPNTKNRAYYDGTIPFLSISDISNSNGLIKKTEKNITKAGLNNSTSYIVPKGSVSLAMYASVGKVAKLFVDSATSQAFFNMEFESETLSNYIYFYLIKVNEENGWEKLISTGSQSNLNAEKVKNFSLTIPQEKEMQKINTFFKSLEEKINSHHKELDKLNHFKQAMLDKMFV